jgi:hypothetical protein
MEKKADLNAALIAVAAVLVGEAISITSWRRTTSAFAMAALWQVR